MQKLKDRLNALQPRERIIVIGGAILVLVTAVYVLGLAPLYAAVNAQAKRVEQKEGDLAWMRSVAGEVAMLSASAPSRNGTPAGWPKPSRPLLDGAQLDPEVHAGRRAAAALDGHHP